MNTEPDPLREKSDATSLVQAAVARHQAPLLRYATRLLSGDADRARDVVQDLTRHGAQSLFEKLTHRLFADLTEFEGFDLSTNLEELPQGQNGSQKGHRRVEPR